MTDLTELARRVCAFRDARDWRQFHSLRSLIVSLNLEAAELLELTQWQTDEAIEALPASDAGRVALADEMADVLMYLLLLAEVSGIDLGEATLAKLAKNELKYPVARCRGRSEKYTLYREDAEASAAPTTGAPET